MWIFYLQVSFQNNTMRNNNACSEKLTNCANGHCLAISERIIITLYMHVDHTISHTMVLNLSCVYHCFAYFSDAIDPSDRFNTTNVCLFDSK